MTEKRLTKQRETWHQKPALRAIYTDFYQQIVAECQPGRTLEVGGGSGNLKELISEVISTDLVPTPWLDAAADAQALPFKNAAFANIVAVDVLHHIERPIRFLKEAERVLQPGGRLILLEPAITPVSWLFYNFFHPEPVILNIDPLADGPTDPLREPFDANQAIPSLLFGRYREHLKQALPLFTLSKLKRMSLLAYPLSGGFRAWSLVPAVIVGPLLKLERIVEPAVGSLMAFRLFTVMTKSGVRSNKDCSP